MEWDLYPTGVPTTSDTVLYLDVDATPPAAGQVKQTTIANLPSSGMSNPMTTLGDLIYENATPAAARLAGSTSATKQFLTQTGTGSASAAPAWGTIAGGDLPSTAVTPGSYTSANITVDATGRLTAASNGSGGGGVTTIAYAGPPTSGTYSAGNLVLDVNNVLWVCYSGGTPGSFTPVGGGKYNPDWPPPASLTYGYEFQASSSSLPSGWSWFNQSGSAYLEGSGAGLLTPAGGNWTGITRTLPTPPFTLITKLRFSQYMNTSDFVKGGILITDGTKIIGFSVGGEVPTISATSTLGGTTGTAVEYFTNNATFSSSLQNWAVAAEPCYWFKIVYTSHANVSFYASADGIGWYGVAVSQNLSGSYLTPNAIGFGCNGFSAHAPISAPQLSCQYFRIS